MSSEAAVAGDSSPGLDRPITLQFRGDWGQYNMHRICGWLAQEIGDRCPAGSRFAIWSGRGGRDQVDALMRGEADIAVLTPAAMVRVLYRGVGPLGGGPHPELRALGVIGQRDRLVLAVDRALGVRSAEDLRHLAPDLVIATAPDDGVNAIGFAAAHALRLAGAAPEELEAAGARFRYWERPHPAVDAFAEGAANVLIQEAIMTPGWQRIAERRDVVYLDWGPAVLAGFEALEWPMASIEAGYLPGLQEDLITLDFSDFVLVCRADLPEDIAHLAAWCLLHTGASLERQYRHIPPDHSPVSYPLLPMQLRATPIPLHPGALRAFADYDAALVASRRGIV